jgi:putative phosphonate metabolism protein
MRYAIYFTPPAYDPLTLAASQWLGRNAFSGEATEPPAVRGVDIQDVAFNTALPRRYGFHGTLKAPFHLAPGITEAMLLRHLMRFAGAHHPFELPPLEVVRLGNFFGLAPCYPCERMNFLAASVVQEFDAFRLPLSEAELERADPGDLSAPQFANLHRWGSPYVMEEFRFHMTLTGPLAPSDSARFEAALRSYFAPYLERRLEVTNLALFVEEEPGAPFQVHSLHPLGRVAARRSA